MRRSHVVTTFFLFFFLLSIWFLQSVSQKSPIPSIRTVLGADITSVPALASSCHEKNGLPDPTCTPGAIDPHVTQQNIQSTICVSGYTKTIRPSVNYTQSLKQQQIVAYGYLDKNLKDYEEDHMIPLEVGGSPTDPKNLWPEPGASPNEKDSVENLCNQKVCGGQITLTTAQKEIATNWKIACQ